jgi:hypothetical protein
LSSQSSSIKGGNKAVLKKSSFVRHKKDKMITQIARSDTKTSEFLSVDLSEEERKKDEMEELLLKNNESKSSLEQA